MIALAAAVLTTGACAGSPAPPADPPVPPAGPTATRSEPAPGVPRLEVDGDAWVSVSVATLWRSPSSPRPVDRPALAAPARIAQWLDAMSTEQRRDLNGRADTQALLGDRVVVLELRPHWARVAVPDQPTPLDDRGYPGWVPRRQLAATRPAASPERATVLAPRAWLRTDDDQQTRLYRVSFGTRLPAVGEVDGFVRVALPGGIVRRLAADKVAVHAKGTPALEATRRSLVRRAKAFVGLEYLWAGRSGFGFDCSGLTSLVHRVHGLVIPRDAGPQSTSGTPVPSGDLRRGDLMFYATGGTVHHVSMYAGKGTMVHSPGTGQSVEVIDVDTPAYAEEYAGARRHVS